MKDLNEVILGTGPGGESIGSGTNAAVSQRSAAVNLNYRYGIAIQILFTGTPVGSVKLQGSCDYGNTQAIQPDGNDQVVNWTDIDNSTTSVSGAGTVSYNFQGSFYKWIRVVYTAVSGAGAITARANSKGF